LASLQLRHGHKARSLQQFLNDTGDANRKPYTMCVICRSRD